MEDLVAKRPKREEAGRAKGQGTGLHLAVAARMDSS